MSYRDDVDALAARCDALEADATSTQRSLAEARQLLAEARARRRLPVLDDLRIAAPCDAAWAEMRGDDRSRLCEKCEKHVFDLSSMTRAEAEALVLAKEGKLCVRYYQRADGTILTADCPDGLARRRRRRRVVAIAFGAASAVIAGGGVLAGGAMRMGAPARTPIANSPPPHAWMGQAVVASPTPVTVIDDAAPPLMGELDASAFTARPKPAVRKAKTAK